MVPATMRCLLRGNVDAGLLQGQVKTEFERSLTEMFMEFTKLSSASLNLCVHVRGSCAVVRLTMPDATAAAALWASIAKGSFLQRTRHEQPVSCPSLRQFAQQRLQMDAWITQARHEWHVENLRERLFGIRREPQPEVCRHAVDVLASGPFDLLGCGSLTLLLHPRGLPSQQAGRSMRSAVSVSVPAHSLPAFNFILAVGGPAGGAASHVWAGPFGLRTPEGPFIPGGDKLRHYCISPLNSLPLAQ